MLRNDIISHDRAKNTDITRNLKNATTRHYQNNPHMSMESSFAYIMSNSGIFRALPVECIEEARRYLDLPTVGIKPKEVTSECKPSLFLVTQDKITPIGWTHIISDDSADTLEAPDKPKPGTTVVHAERVVVDNKKMIKILKFENVRKAFTLPKEYVYGMPRFYESNDGVVFARFENPSTIIKSYHPGNVITQTEFGQMIKTMKEAGVRLSKINKTAKLESEHSGKFVVSV